MASCSCPTATSNTDLEHYRRSRERLLVSYLPSELEVIV